MSDEGAEPRYEPVRMPDGWLGVRPLPSEDELRAFYADVYYQDLPSSTYQSSYDDDELAYKRLRVDLLLLALRQAGVGPEAGMLLELGAGEGFLLAAAVRDGWEVTGIDHSTFAVERFNPDVAHLLVEGDAEDHLQRLAAEGVRIGACVLVNVLEHVRDPGRLLRSVAEVLAPDGAVVVTVPNDDSPLQHEVRRLELVDHDPWFVPPQHLAYFNAITGPAFARARGFDIVDLYADFPIDWYLLHPGSNYVADPTRGKAAHRARITMELLLARAGHDRVIDLWRSLAACGGGRDLTMVLRPVGSGV